jgi:hypothetical protein
LKLSKIGEIAVCSVCKLDGNVGFWQIILGDFVAIVVFERKMGAAGLVCMA